MRTIPQLQVEAYANSVAHGFGMASFGERIALIHSELSEALECYRNDEPSYYLKDGKPEGIAAELADAVIRILDTCEASDIDLNTAIEDKMAYNKTRPFKHGGKKL